MEAASTLTPSLLLILQWQVSGMSLTRRLSYFAIVGVLLAAALLYLCRPTAARVEALIERLDLEVTLARWAEAEKTVAEIQRQWQKRRAWFSLEESDREISGFDRALTHARAYVHTRAAADIRAELLRIRRIWREFGG